MMGPLTQSRVSPERLLELLEHKGLWKDVDWTPTGTHDAYDDMARTLGNSAHLLFKGEHLGRLRAILERESHPPDGLCIKASVS
jgi:hypothetical protein